MALNGLGKVSSTVLYSAVQCSAMTFGGALENNTVQYTGKLCNEVLCNIVSNSMVHCRTCVVQCNGVC